jgi:hypothetical protein
MITRAKLLAVAALLELGHRVLFLDADVVVFSDPLKALNEGGGVGGADGSWMLMMMMKMMMVMTMMTMMMMMMVMMTMVMMMMMTKVIKMMMMMMLMSDGSLYGHGVDVTLRETCCFKAGVGVPPWLTDNRTGTGDVPDLMFQYGNLPDRYVHVLMSNYVGGWWAPRVYTCTRNLCFLVLAPDTSHSAWQEMYASGVAETFPLLNTGVIFAQPTDNAR